jgi:predicted regulator of Ras-like GTPase activity (Roadblock/LC7/MglB family)
MKTKDYSEIEESAGLLKAFLGSEKTTALERKSSSESDSAAMVFEFGWDAREFESLLPSIPVVERRRIGSKEKRLEKILETMCEQGSFHGALIADDNGFPIASFKTPKEAEALAAFTPFLGQVIDKTVQLFERKGADSLSIDIDAKERVVLRRFNVREFTFFLLVICSRRTTELGEIDLPIDLIKTFLI